jgi:hypothetical protein
MTAKSVLSADHFHDEAAALAFIETRVWPQGPKCPRCGEMARVSRMLCSSKKGISTHQLQRTLGVTLKSAWFLSHRLREAMNGNGLGGAGSVVEADETYFGKAADPQPSPQRQGRAYIHKGGGPAGKRAVVSLVERGGKSRTFHVGNANKETVQGLIRANVAPETRLHTDESRLYGGIIAHVANHETIHHTAGEYVRGDVTTNSVEGFFSVFKRGMRCGI